MRFYLLLLFLPKKAGSPTCGSLTSLLLDLTLIINYLTTIQNLTE